MKLTKRRLDVLNKMNSGTDLTYSSGEWWLDLERIGSSIGVWLLRNILIREMYCNNNGKYVIYEINDAGRKLLNGKSKIYRDSNGVYHETIEELQLSVIKEDIYETN